MSTKSNYQAPYDGEKFDNLEPFPVKSLFNLLKWQLSGGKKEWPDSIENTHHEKPVTRHEDSSIKYLMIGHATILIQLEGMNILTDPFFSDRASPVSFMGPKRSRAVALSVEELPLIDYVLVSHNHYDHLDLPTLKKLEELFSPVFYVGLKNAKLLESIGLKKVVELDWWQEVQLKSGALTFVPAQHWSARGLADRLETLWGGFYYKSEKANFYFAGDTGYGSFFKEIKKRLGPPLLSFLPIGSYEPRWFMKDAHMNPEDAVKAHLDLESTHSVGMHFGTIRLTDEGPLDPASDLKTALEKLVVKYPFIAPDFGKVYEFQIHSVID